MISRSHCICVQGEKETRFVRRRERDLQTLLFPRPPMTASCQITRPTSLWSVLQCNHTIPLSA